MVDLGDQGLLRLGVLFGGVSWVEEEHAEG
jgi:hypothetical protein